MFERFNEPARRTLFFSRFEASQLGSLSIGTAHILLGLMREADGVVAQVLATSHISPDDLRKEIERQFLLREKVSTSIEMPFDAETKLALQYAAEEADGLCHNYIGKEHLFLGLLREEHTVAGSILNRRGLRADDVRKQVIKLLAENPASPSTWGRADMSLQIDHIREMVEQLAGLASGSETQALAGRIRDSLDRLKRQIVG